MGQAVSGETKDLKVGTAKPRKPYQKPTFRFERVFETMALACGKIAPTQKHCQFVRKSS